MLCVEKLKRFVWVEDNLAGFFFSTFDNSEPMSVSEEPRCMWRQLPDVHDAIDGRDRLISRERKMLWRSVPRAVRWERPRGVFVKWAKNGKDTKTVVCTG